MDKEKISSELIDILGKENVLLEEEECRPFELDAYVGHPQLAEIVLFVESREDVVEVMKLCNREGISVVARGAGTSLSGGAIPVSGGILVCLNRMNKVKEVDVENRCIVAGPGVTNLSLSEYARPHGLFYAPDPSSQLACSIGGNFAENSGGLRCLKYGLTTNHIIGAEIVLASGEVLRLGGKHGEGNEIDLLGCFVGSEGTLGIVTEITVNLVALPETYQAMLVGFGDVVSAGRFVADVIASGIIPASLEFMDKFSIQAAEKYAKAGYPLDVEALILVDFDAPPRETEDLMGRVRSYGEKNGASVIRMSTTSEERENIWKGRRTSFSSVGQLWKSYICTDGAIPRKSLPLALERIQELSAEHGMPVCNVFHAGDGNLHPLIGYDPGIDGELEKAERLGDEILKLSVDLEGTISGEHGIGIEKKELLDYMFNEEDLASFLHIKHTLDESYILNPDKIFTDKTQQRYCEEYQELSKE